MPVDYDRDLYHTYRAGRALASDTGRLWMDAIAGHACSWAAVGWANAPANQSRQQCPLRLL